MNGNEGVDHHLAIPIQNSPQKSWRKQLYKLTSCLLGSKNIFQGGQNDDCVLRKNLQVSRLSPIFSYFYLLFFYQGMPADLL